MPKEQISPEVYCKGRKRTCTKEEYTKKRHGDFQSCIDAGCVKPEQPADERILSKEVNRQETQSLIPQIAESIETILAENHCFIAGKDYIRAPFEDLRSPGHFVVIYFSNEKLQDLGEGGFEHLPRTFRIPFFSLYDFTTEGSFEVSSPYGPLLSLLIDSQNRIFEIQNGYFFNKFGDAVKVEDVALISDKLMTLESNLKNLCGEEAGKEIRRVNFALSEGDSRAISLTREDYEKVIRLIDALHSKKGLKLHT